MVVIEELDDDCCALEENPGENDDGDGESECVLEDEDGECVLEDEDGEPAIRVHEEPPRPRKKEPGYFDYDPGLENWSGDEDDDTEAGRLHREAGRLLDEQEANMTEEDRAALRAAEGQHALLGFADSVA